MGESEAGILKVVGLLRQGKRGVIGMERKGWVCSRKIGIVEIGRGRVVIVIRS